MSRLDRYILRKFFGTFAFMIGLFCLVVAVLLRLIVETLAQPDQLQRLLEARNGD